MATESGRGLKNRAHALPTYIVDDSGGRERFKFFGGMAEKDFIERLDIARKGAPFMVKTADLFDQKQALEAWFLVANGYGAVRAPQKPREAWDRARHPAQSRGDAATAQVAEMNSAFTWAIEGNAPKALAALDNISASPFNAEHEAMRHLLRGRVFVGMKDLARARAAFEKAVALGLRTMPSR